MATVCCNFVPQKCRHACLHNSYTKSELSWLNDGRRVINLSSTKTSVKTQQPTWKYLILSVDSFVQLTKFFNSNSYVHELGGPRNQTLLPVCSLCIISCKYCLNGQFCPTNCNFKHIQFTLISKGGKMRFRRGVTN